MRFLNKHTDMNQSSHYIQLRGAGHPGGIVSHDVTFIVCLQVLHCKGALIPLPCAILCKESLGVTHHQWWGRWERSVWQLNLSS